MFDFISNIVRTREKRKVYFSVFHSECSQYSPFMGKYMKNKLKNIKFACIYLAVVNFNLEQQVYKVIGPT